MPLPASQQRFPKTCPDMFWQTGAHAPGTAEQPRQARHVQDKGCSAPDSAVAALELAQQRQVVRFRRRLAGPRLLPTLCLACNDAHARVVPFELIGREMAIGATLRISMTGPAGARLCTTQGRPGFMFCSSGDFCAAGIAPCTARSARLPRPSSCGRGRGP